jgi:6-pyruvoyltetrahydropterin/6-carboxytetrahydropterin synthase
LRGVNGRSYAVRWGNSQFEVRGWLPIQHFRLIPGCKTAMFQVTRLIDFCYGHRLLNYAGKCRFLHGHNGRAEITLEGSGLDERGMVMDFSEIKKSVSEWIDDTLDHRMILHRDDPVVPMLQEMGEPMYLLDVNPTAENIAKLIFEFTASRGFPIVEARLWETPRCFAAYVKREP